MAAFCHHDQKGLWDMLKAARVIAYRTDDLVLNVSDYLDFLGPLSEILRCEVCFGDYLFNGIDARTGLRYEWSDIGEVLEADETFKPPPGYRSIYQDSRKASSLSNSSLAPALFQSVWKAAKSMGCYYEDLAWQIIRNSNFMEQPNGPRDHIHRGDWKSLAQHTVDSIRKMESTYEYEGLQCDAARIVAHAIRSVQRKWFDEVEMDDGMKFVKRYALTQAASGLDTQLAASGSPHPKQNYRRVPLMDTKPFPPVQPPMVSPFTKEPWKRVRSMRDSTACSRDPNTILLEPIAGYQSTLENHISSDQITMINTYVERIKGIKTKMGLLPDSDQHEIDPELYRTLQDLTSILLAGINYPGLYSIIFLVDAEKLAGSSDEILKEEGIFRIQGRGYIRFRDLEGLVPEYQRLTENRKLAVTVARMRDELEAGSKIDTKDYPDLFRNKLVSSNAILYLNEPIILLADALEKHLGFSLTLNGQQSRDLRRVDLTKALRFLAAHSLLQGPWDGRQYPWTNEQARLIVTHAGDSDEVLASVGLTRDFSDGIQPSL